MNKENILNIKAWILIKYNNKKQKKEESIKQIKMKIERTYLDKFINGAFFNKRQIGRPIKYNIRGKGRMGYLFIINYLHFISVSN